MGKEKTKLFLIETNKHDAPLVFVDSVMRATEVKACSTCGCVFTPVDHRLGQCPLKHDQ